MFPGCPEHCKAEGKLTQYSWNIACLLRTTRGGVFLLVYFEDCHAVVGYQRRYQQRSS